MSAACPKRLASVSAGLLAAVLPVLASAQDIQTALGKGNALSAVVSFLAFLLVSLIFSRLWIGIVNASFIHEESIGSIEKRQPYLPSPKVIAGTLLGTFALFLLSLKGLERVFPVEGQASVLSLGLIFALIGGAALAVEQRWRRSREFVFAGMIGTAIAIILIGLQHSLFQVGTTNDPYFMALAILCIALAWRCLFGPWNARVKATVLGTFLFWIGVYLIASDPVDMRMARILAGMVALIPALIWCGFFLKYHYQQASLVLLMFFAGMLSTVPILFYDRLVRSGAEMQFFFFRIVPENFNRTSSAFVSGNLVGITSVKSTLIATLLSFLFVGVVEEVSKFWVMKNSGKTFFSSIDDVMQLSIIVAIGFAFAENIVNPTYFTGFVQDFLISHSPNWGGFLGNVMGRAILTNMVHIVSTGVLGYFFGLALFAGPYMRDVQRKGRVLWIAEAFHSLLGYPEKMVFRRQMLFLGLTLAVALHGLFNFLVTFPDILPARPSSLGELFGLAPGSVLHYIPLLMIPSLFYVVGGFWLLTDLFYRKENMKERGHIVSTDTFVKSQVVA